MQATFVRKQPENPSGSIMTFYFRSEGRFRYEAGQYAVMTVPHDNPDDRGINRTMTISSSPHENTVAFTMRIYKDGSSFKQALMQLKPGAKITIQESLGDLVLPLNPAIPLVFVAGGVAIASYTGMVKWLLRQGEQRTITLLHAVRTPEDIIMKKPFEQYARRFGMQHTIYDSSRSERLRSADIIAAAADDAIVYLSGTESMVDKLREQLKDRRFDFSRVVYDYFDGYSEI